MRTSATVAAAVLVGHRRSVSSPTGPPRPPPVGTGLETKEGLAANNCPTGPERPVPVETGLETKEGLAANNCPTGPEPVGTGLETKEPIG